MPGFLVKYFACIVLALGLILSVGTSMAVPGDDASQAAQPDVQPDTAGQQPEPAVTLNEQAYPAISNEQIDYVSGNEADARLYEVLSEAQASIKDKDYDAAKKKLASLYGICRDLGITSYEALSANLVKEGRNVADSGDFTGAMLLFDSAIKISPNYPLSYYAKGWEYLSQNKLKVLIAADTMIEGFGKSLDDFWWSLNYTANMVTSLLFTMAALFSLFGLFIAIRYTPLIAHDIAEKFDRPESEPLLKYVVIPVVYLAILVTLGYWWAVTIVLLTLWVYFNRREKSLAILFFVLLVFMPDVMGRYAKFIQASGNELLWVYDDVNKGHVAPSTEAYLKKNIEQDPSNKPAMFALARLYKEEHRYAESVELYNALIEAEPEVANYRVNLGNLYFILNNYDKAIEEYQVAITYDAENTLAHFNLSQVYGENLMFSERDEQDRTATGLDPQLVAEMKSRQGETPLRLVFDARIPKDYMWNLAFYDSPGTHGLESSMWSTTVKILPLSGAMFAGIGFIVLVIAINALGRKSNFAHFCEKCGKVSCVQCQRPHYNKDLCPQCHQIFVKLDGVEARDRLKKTLEIRVNQSREGMIYRISSLLLPGSGHYLFGRPLRGFILSGLFIFLVKDIFFGSFFVNHYSYALSIISPDKVLMGLVMLAVYSFTQLDIYRLTKK